MIPLRVVSYNVHSSRDDPVALASVVRSLAPDILIVQEAPRRLAWRARCARLAHAFGLCYAEGGLPSLGNLLLTNLRVRVLESWSMRYPLTPGRHMRGAAFARCAVPDAGPFVIAGTHLSTYDSERPGQALLLKPALRIGNAPVVLGADLNETDTGESWRLLADGLTDAGAGAGDTFPAGAPDRRIDAIFTDPRITVAGFAVHTSPDALRASDHLPLVADLLLPPALSS